MEQKKEAEELEHFKELYIQDQMTLEQKKQEGKRNTMKAYQVSSSVIKNEMCPQHHDHITLVNILPLISTYLLDVFHHLNLLASFLFYLYNFIHYAG